MKEIDRFIQIKSNKLKPAKGRLLLSEPFMSDYYFGRSVILLAEHDDKGSFGIIMNKPVTVGFNEVLKDFPDFDSPIYLGGPVETNSLFYVHSLGDKIEGSVEITSNLFWGGDIETIKEMILLKTIQPGDIRFFIGYSGWGANQLDAELKRNSWIILRSAKLDLLSIDPMMMWESLMNSMGKEYSYWTKFPIDPTVN